MPLLRSGLVLFVSVTAVSAIISLALFYAVMGRGPLFISDFYPTLLLTIPILPMVVTLMVLASRGRRRPITDGITLMTCIALGVCGLLVALPNPPSEFGWGFDAMIMTAHVGAGLACVVPAHIITVLALRRTPLLAGLVPPRKSKGPAEASP